MALSPSAETARVLADGLVGSGLDKLPWSKPLQQWRDRVMFLRKAEREASQSLWPDLSDDALAAQREAWLMPALMKDFVEGVSPLRATCRRTDDAKLPWGTLRARLDVSADVFSEAPTAPASRSTEAEQGPTTAVDCRNCSGSTPIRRSVEARCRWCWSCSPLPPAGAGDARPAGLLARQLCGGSFRSARALSEASLAGRSSERDADPAREAAGDIGARFEPSSRRQPSWRAQFDPLGRER